MNPASGRDKKNEGVIAKQRKQKSGLKVHEGKQETRWREESSPGEAAVTI